MKRGFLLDENPKKDKAKASSEPKREASPPIASSSFTPAKPTTKPDVQITAFDELRDIRITPTNSQLLCSARLKTLPSRIPSSLPPNALVCTRIPPLSTSSTGSSCVLYLHTLNHLLASPNFPVPDPPASTLAYEVKRAEGMGLGLFATHPLNTGDLILVERPLIVVPICPDVSSLTSCPPLYTSFLTEHRKLGTRQTPLGILEPLIKTALERLGKDDQRAYLSLENVHREKLGAGLMLSGIWRTNAFDLVEVSRLGEEEGEGDMYCAVFQFLSRVNHSCRPNIAWSFSPASFTLQLRASKPIAKCEQLFTSYINPALSTSQRQTALLQTYNFTCHCFSCLPPSSLQPSTSSAPDPTIESDKIRTSIPERVRALHAEGGLSMSVVKDPTGAKRRYDACMQLLKDMENEGMEGCIWYRRVMEMRVMACMNSSVAAAAVAGRMPGEERVWIEEAEMWKDVVVKLALAHEGSFVKHPWDE